MGRRVQFTIGDGLAETGFPDQFVESLRCELVNRFISRGNSVPDKNLWVHEYVACVP